MANININNKLSVNGNLTFTKTLITNDQGKQEFAINGALSTHLYFDDISELETGRYILKNVEVYQEVYGSDDYNIIYYFKAKESIVKGYEYDGGKFILYPKEMEQIEDIMYKNDHPILGNIGEEYKNIVMEDSIDE